MSPRTPDESIFREMEERLNKLRPHPQEELARNIKAELEATDFAGTPAQHLSYKKPARTPRYALGYGLGGFILGAVAMFLGLWCSGERFTKVVVHEVVREIPVTPPPEEKSPSPSEKLSPPLNNTLKNALKNESPAASWSVLHLLGFAPEKPLCSDDFEEILKRQRELAERPRRSSSHFVMQPVRSGPRSDYDTSHSYRAYRETLSQHL